jgi:protein-S-isoprenylcysteine O-methyltransferase Ste14
VKKRLKINGVIMACGTLTAAIFPRFFLRPYAGGISEEMVETVGFGLILLGQIIRVSARGYKSEHSQDSRVLIQGGPYQVVRNPMYLGIFLIGLGVTLAIFKPWAVGIFIAVFILRYILLIYKEEKKLLITFPDAYAQYCKKVPRLFPSMVSIIKLDIIEYLPVKLTWFKKEIGSIITLLIFTLLVESWEDITAVGFTTYLRQSAWIFLTFALFAVLVILLSKYTNKNDEHKTAKS